MTPRFDHIDDLIGKVLAGEATARETHEVQTWCDQNQDNQQYFDQLKTIFETAAAKQVRISFDTDAAWQKVKTKLKRELNYWPVIRLAAGIILTLTVFIYTYQWLNQPTQTVAMVSGQGTAQDTLPDGTVAFLNKKSSITYEYQARGKTRKVRLKGEGFFDVKHEAEKSFLIEAEGTLIRDLGTSFNVKAYTEADTVEVVVLTGVVQFYTLKDPGVQLNAGETGLYTRRGKFFTKIQRADTNVLSYKTGIFSFHATDLRTVIDRINEVHGSQIKLASEELGGCELTVTFKNEDLNTMVDVIAETMSLTVERNDKDEIILNGNGCQ